MIAERSTTPDSDAAYQAPQLVALTSTAQDAFSWKRTAAAVAEQSRRVIVAMSCHWGSSEVRVETHDQPRMWRPESSVISSTGEGGDGVAGRAIDLLRKSGLQSPGHHNNAVNPMASCVHVSVPAHFGVELMMLVGTALRPLHREAVFLALCGTFDPMLRELVSKGRLDALTQFARQLPKHRVTELYPLFALIGVSAGAVRGVLDRVISSGGQERSERVSPYPPTSHDVGSHVDESSLIAGIL